jgi:hypothetical protein
MGAVDNESVLVVPFIGAWGSRSQTVKGREAATVELQSSRLWEMETKMERQWVRPFLEEEEREEARRLHSARGGGHNEERRLASVGRR